MRRSRLRRGAEDPLVREQERTDEVSDPTADGRRHDDDVAALEQHVRREVASLDGCEIHPEDLDLFTGRANHARVARPGEGGRTAVSGDGFCDARLGDERADADASDLAAQSYLSPYSPALAVGEPRGRT